MMSAQEGEVNEMQTDAEGVAVSEMQTDAEGVAGGLNLTSAIMRRRKNCCGSPNCNVCSD